jgi:nucleoside-diphosphate-sugar epimerase
MKKAVITGASGFVGSNLARRLLADGHEVHLLLREGHTGWRLEEIMGDVQPHIIELGDEEQLARLMGSIRPEWIFHLAAHGAYSSQTDMRRMFYTNVLGTAHLLNACLHAGFEAFVHTGSSSEYGFKGHPPSETERLEPNSCYAVTKASATLYCRYMAQSRKAPISTLRLYSVYGPYEEPTRFVPTLIIYGLRKSLPPLVDPDIARDFVYVDDVNDAYIAAASMAHEEPGAVYNVGTGTQTTIREAVDVACRLLKIDVEPQWGSMKNRIWDTSTWLADNRAIREKLGWRPRHDFESGFRKMVTWFRVNPAMLRLYTLRGRGNE